MTQKSLTSAVKDIPSKVSVPNFYKAIGLIFIIIGVGFYVGWSIPYNTWTDVGVYSFVLPLIVLGIFTLLLVDEKQRLKEQENQ